MSEQSAATQDPAESVQRLFFAVPLPRSLQAATEVVQRALQRANADIKWVEPHNLHFTLKFLGDRPLSQAPALAEVARAVAAEASPARVGLCGLGAFPHNQWPQVVWVGCDSGGSVLAELAHRLDEALDEAGLASRDKRPFEPHLTLGRARSNRRLKGLVEGLAQYGGVEIGPLALTSFALMSSRLSPQGPTYTLIEEFPLRPRPEAPA